MQREPATPGDERDVHRGVRAHGKTDRAVACETRTTGVDGDRRDVRQRQLQGPPGAGGARRGGRRAAPPPPPPPPPGGGGRAPPPRRPPAPCRSQPVRRERR